MFDEPFPNAPESVALQTVLYQTPVDSLVRALEALDNSAMVGKRELFCSRFVVVLGDASPVPLLNEGQVEELRSRLSSIDELVYHYFDDNTGTSRGQNAMASMADTDFILIANPDVVADARAIWRMVTVFNDPGVGIVEAKQLPVEHPKDYDRYTGFTGWATGAFSMIRRELFTRLGGYDDQSFFLYCDDVDLSWRVREAGYSVVFMPSAVVFHDKRLSVLGKWQATAAEYFYSAQAALLLPHKWSRDDVVERVLDLYQNSERPEHLEAVDEFLRRRETGTLAAQRDPDHKIATFVGSFYTEHRYPL